MPRPRLEKKSTNASRSTSPSTSGPTRIPRTISITTTGSTNRLPTTVARTAASAIIATMTRKLSLSTPTMAQATGVGAGPAEADVVGGRTRRRARRDRRRPRRDRRVEQRELLLDRGPVQGRRRLEEAEHERAHPARHLRRIGAVAAQLRQRQLEQLAPAGDGMDDAQRPVLREEAADVEVAADEVVQQGLECVDRLRRRRRVVDGRRQRAQGDVHDRADRVGRVLRDRALLGEQHGALQLAAADGRVAAADAEQRRAGAHVAADRDRQLDDRLRLRGGGDEPLAVERRDHAAGTVVGDHLADRRQRRRLDALGGRLVRVHVGDRVLGGRHELGVEPPRAQQVEQARDEHEEREHREHEQPGPDDQRQVRDEARLAADARGSPPARRSSARRRLPSVCLTTWSRRKRSTSRGVYWTGAERDDHDRDRHDDAGEPDHPPGDRREDVARGVVGHAVADEPALDPADVRDHRPQDDRGDDVARRDEQPAAGDPLAGPESGSPADRPHIRATCRSCPS